jgi:hypothetical protein
MSYQLLSVTSKILGIDQMQELWGHKMTFVTNFYWDLCPTKKSLESSWKWLKVVYIVKLLLTFIKLQISNSLQLCSEKHMLQIGPMFT